MSSVNNSCVNNVQPILEINQAIDGQPSADSTTELFKRTISESQSGESNAVSVPPIQNAVLRVNFQELPQVYQTVISDMATTELSVLNFLVYKMFSLTSQISHQGKACFDKQLSNISKAIPTLELIVMSFKNKDLSSEGVEQYCKYVSATCSKIQEELAKMKANTRRKNRLSEEKKMLVDLLNEIVTEIKKSALMEGVNPVNYDTILIDLQNRGTDRLKNNVVDKFDEIISVAQDLKLYFSRCFELFFKENEALKGLGRWTGQDYYNVMKNSEKTLKSYIKNLNNMKKNIDNNTDLEKILEVYDYTYEKFINFNNFVLAMKGLGQDALLQISWELDIIDEKFFDLSMFSDIPKGFRKPYFGCESFKRMLSSLRCSFHVLRHNVLLTIDTCVEKQDKIIDVQATESHIQNFRAMYMQLMETNFSMKSSKSGIIDPKGVHSVNHIFQIIENDIDQVERSFNRLKLNGGKGFVGEFYMVINYFKNRLYMLQSDIITKYLAELQSSLEQYKSSISGFGRKKVSRNAAIVELENSLVSVDDFMKVYEKHCVSVIEILENFVGSFFKKEILEPVVESTTLESEPKVIDTALSIELEEELQESTIKEEIPELPEECSLGKNATISIIEKSVEDLKESLSKEHSSVSNVKRRALIKEIIEYGYRLVNGGKGSHAKLNDSAGNVIIVPKGYSDNSISPGVVNSIRSQLQSGTQKIEATAKEKTSREVDASRPKKSSKKKPKTNYKKKR
ncbi:MAG: hypothetical protein VX777_10845 [Chlamydiota bacterium]|nr:hypothetical protein [Chlamydiota bacterium]